MFYEKLHIIIALIAALICTVISVLNGDSAYAFSVKLVICVISFYLLGSILKVYLDKRVFKRKDDNMEPEAQTQAADDED